ncbi:MAG: mechanosensitive ion channel family protein [Rubrivivax sp.]|nr:mechanosensitive ion channel family protein [Rubrivivax sp.]
MNQDNFFEMLSRALVGMGGATTAALRITVILVAAWVLVAVLRRAVRAFRARLAARLDDVEAVKRAETLARVFRYLITVVVSLVAGMLVLGEIGISVAPILGAAGVVGLAVGFGAQSLVRDYFTGFFILLENQIRQGDIVQLSSDHAGFVEEVTLRYVRLRDYDGRVHFVPNGQITSIINSTREFAFAVLDVGVAYRENVDEVMALMQDVARGLREDADFAPRILDDLEMAGVNAWGDSAVVVRARIKCVPPQQWAVKREYLRRLKAVFDERGIEIPFPHLTVYAGQDKQGAAPALPLRLQRPPRPVAAPAEPRAAAERSPRAA